MPRPRRRKAAWEPQMEMTPLLDVIFLLLTFFIYSLVVMVQANVLPVRLPHLSASKKTSSQKITGITIDRENRLFLNREPVDRENLKQKLSELAAGDDKPVIYVALEEAPASVDRSPTLLDVIDQLRGSGIEDFYIVGRPENAATTP